MLETTLARAIGNEGREVLDRLATPQTRIVVPEEESEGLRYVLSHDRLAEVLVRAVDHDGCLGELKVDSNLLALHRFVVLRSELFRSGEQEAAVDEVPKATMQLISANTETLLWGSARLQWWTACQEKQRADLRRRLLVWASAGAALVAIAVLTFGWAQRRAHRNVLLERVAGGEPAAALVAFDQLSRSTAIDPNDLFGRLHQRATPTEILEMGPRWN